METEHAREYEEHGIQAYRIERGAEVIGTDGSLGTVEQIVVDGDSGELQSLVVRGEAGMFMELPASRIDSATGDQVYLSLGKSDLAAQPNLARPFKPELYIPVDEGAVVPPGEVTARDPNTPVLTEMETDAIEIATPTTDEAATDDAGDDTLAGEGGADIADQPTIVLGPDGQMLPTTMAQPSPVGETAGLVAPGNVRPANAVDTPATDQRAVDELEPEPISTADENVPTPAAVELTANPEPVAPEPATPEPSYGVTAPRVDEGTAYANLPERDMSTYLTAAILAGTAVASIAYLLWSRRQRERSRGLPGVSEARSRLAGVRAAGAVAQQSLSAQASQLAPRARSLSASGRQTALRAQSRLGDLWELATDRAEDLGAMLVGVGGVADLARRQARAATHKLPAASDVRDALATRLPGMPAMDGTTLRARAGELTANAQGRLDDMADTVRGWIPNRGRWTQIGQAAQRWRPGRKPPQLAAGQAVSHKTNEAKRATRRGARRLGRRVRWFRNGMLAGAVWGILYAPVAGRDARSAAARYLQRVPFLSDYVGTGEEVSGAVGGTGPRPRSDLASGHVPYPGTLGGTPLLEPTSEEPLLPTPEGDIGSLPSGKPAL